MLDENKVMVAMSGGVDSAASALLLRDQGFQVMGMTIDTGAPGIETALADAAALCRELGIEHLVIDGRERFRQKVVEAFVREYASASTPNPCICCNIHIKFPLLKEAADAHGCYWMATGHYGRVLRDTQDRVRGASLHRGLDATKDQSYVLYGIGRDILERLLLPLGTLSKDAVRQRVAAAGLSAAHRQESQDICFVPDGDHVAFLMDRDPGSFGKSGEIVDRDGRLLGTHRGLESYTIGQRRGLGIGGGTPRFVLEKDADLNRLVVGFEDDLLVSGFCVRDLAWLIDPAEFAPTALPINVKIRYRSQPVPALLNLDRAEEPHARIDFREPYKGIAPGQAAVFYGDGAFYPEDMVLGGGTIRISETT